MQRQVILTNDGSQTVSIPEMSVTYHSKHGAVQESMHVFIKTGLEYVVARETATPLRVFEVGLGTGLNALLTLQFAQQQQKLIQYTAIELFPLEGAEFSQLNYELVEDQGDATTHRGSSTMQRDDLNQAFLKMHVAQWNEFNAITPEFTLRKLQLSLLESASIHPAAFNLVYFDAFAPAAQPELWTAEAFRIIYDLLAPGGIMVTYCSKSIARKAMTEAGFRVTK
ncbi:MAG: SAM-dependent methyltransferase, partial [Pedobacter sp.]